MQTDKEYAIQLAMEYGFTGSFDAQGDLTYDSEFVQAILEAIQHEREACEKRFMQLFLDPENQPTQFGTATQEYREQEIAEVSDLLFELASRIRTTHLYGPEVKKMLEQEEAIRARGEA